MRTPSSVATLPGRAAAFGPFTFDRTSRLLWKDGTEISLPPRVLGVLSLLLERPGELVTKQELIGAVWRDAFVTETSLAEAVSVLRQTLGDDPQRPTYIQTLHRRGYRFIADVQEPSAHAGALQLTETVLPAPTVGFEPRISVIAPWIVTLFAVLTAAAAVWQYVNRGAPPPRLPVRFAVALPDGVAVAPGGGSAAVSDDGALIAFAGCRRTDLSAGARSAKVDCAIYLRPLSESEFTVVAGTAGGAAPFFSRDSRSLGYYANGRLYLMPLGGGSPMPIADAPEPLGATWLGDGQVVFARSSSEGLFVVAPQSGRVQALTRPSAGEGGHQWPSALPDESGIVFTVAGGVRGDQRYAALALLRGNGWGRLLDGATAARVPIPGYLLAQRGPELVATTFDARSRAIVGLPVRVGSAVPADGVPHYAMSPAGTLVIAATGSSALHVVLDWPYELRRLVPVPEPTLPR